ncbi:hypothetical protein IE81DRAFT_229025 [Ceraceosorus guamensis]|uniref:Uncharacterized protein n=1 Tax=Ceraceosorus guamensis TaxID=1522189 RepID=A0A316W7H9_9BASI|nr:hypothetical protein IE81DRAFT_229025 [Ceraceosorus guamensis]PWN45088.1 hypothetical protein IE81DRAFT_229025 [Ceraceosorus guamensis]
MVKIAVQSLLFGVVAAMYMGGAAAAPQPQSKGVQASEFCTKFTAACIDVCPSKKNLRVTCTKKSPRNRQFNFKCKCDGKNRTTRALNRIPTLGQADPSSSSSSSTSTGTSTGLIPTVTSGVVLPTGQTSLIGGVTSNIPNPTSVIGSATSEIGSIVESATSEIGSIINGGASTITSVVGGVTSTIVSVGASATSEAGAIASSATSEIGGIVSSATSVIGNDVAPTVTSALDGAATSGVGIIASLTSQVGSVATGVTAGTGLRKRAAEVELIAEVPKSLSHRDVEIEKRQSVTTFCQQYRDGCARQCARVSSVPQKQTCKRIVRGKKSDKYSLYCSCANGKLETQHALNDIDGKGAKATVVSSSTVGATSTATSASSSSTGSLVLPTSVLPTIV